MTTLHGVYVPTDVIDLVLDCLDNGETKSYLSNLSLVSQAWYELAFPCLHRMVMIRNIAHFEMLVSRVELETANNSLRISHHLRDLRFVVQGWHWDNCQSLMERFQLVIRKLVNLGHLKWAGCSDLIPIPTLESFGRRPQLRRLTISLANLGGISGDFYKQLLSFKNLSHLNILGIVNPSEPGLMNEIVVAINNSPQLCQLELHLGALPTRMWRPSELFENLKPLPRLTKLRVAGGANFDWTELTNISSKPRPLRVFFERHPQLREIHLGNTSLHVYQPPAVFSPGLVNHLFPSVEHFTGPASICLALVDSPLSANLKSLNVLFERGAQWHIPQMEMFRLLANAGKPLPNLTTLAFIDPEVLYVLSNPPHVDVSSLEKILKMTPALVRLNLQSFSYNLIPMINALQQVPLLEELTLHVEEPNSYLKEVRWILAEVAANRLARSCSNLRTVKFVLTEGGMETRRVLRREGLEPTTVQLG
ncbi:hypothetical protein CTheo_7078 [Ceratobasidium theobromae]|uniref:F-box domain-containing protein n=1 Tax=Ceratobasidium theobromae TaxID=1582974 RepID=A0A5N5QCI0_9AGAM|nr:hypothetical protein CTheo_7078 [Ceratobasidium theobromae]